MVIAVQTKKLEYPCATSCVNGKVRRIKGSVFLDIIVFFVTVSNGLWRYDETNRSCLADYSLWNFAEPFRDEVCVTALLLD